MIENTKVKGRKRLKEKKASKRTNQAKRRKNQLSKKLMKGVGVEGQKSSQTSPSSPPHSPLLNSHSSLPTPHSSHKITNLHKKKVPKNSKSKAQSNQLSHRNQLYSSPHFNSTHPLPLSSPYLTTITSPFHQHTTKYSSFTPPTRSDIPTS